MGSVCEHDLVCVGLHKGVVVLATSRRVSDGKSRVPAPARPRPAPLVCIALDAGGVGQPGPVVRGRSEQSCANSEYLSVGYWRAPSVGPSKQLCSSLGRAEKTLDLRGYPASSTDPERYAALRRYLAAPPIGAMNTVLVGHGNPFRAVAGPPHLKEGEAAVIKPLGGQALEIAARVQVQE